MKKTDILNLSKVNINENDTLFQQINSVLKVIMTELQIIKKGQTELKVGQEKIEEKAVVIISKTDVIIIN